MIFGPVQPTQYDLTFTLLKVPVRVSVWHWLVAAIFGYDKVQMGPQFLLAWILVFFISILIHEMGHALTARYFGYSPKVQLHGIGGVAFFDSSFGYTRTRSILISLAGPGAGFILCGLAIAAYWFGMPFIEPSLSDAGAILLNFVLLNLVFVNIVWGVLNLLPILPLDGGQVCRDVCQWASPRRGMEYSLKIGIVFAALATLFFFQSRQIYAALMFGFLCANNISTLQGGGRRW